MIPDKFEQILFDVAGPRATITFNRPEKLNALSPTLIREALAATQWVAEQPDIRVLVVRNTGRAFSAGVDLKSEESKQGNLSPFAENARLLAETWEKMPQATIGCIDGLCLTGGVEIALGLDLLICSDRSQFADTHAKIGFWPGWGLGARLPRRIGIQRAKEMAFTARFVPAHEAREMGLVLSAVPVEELDATLDRLVEGIMSVSAGSIAVYKDIYRRQQNSTLDEALSHERNHRYSVADTAARRAETTQSLGGSKTA